MINLPAPLTSADTDVRDLDGFMLNVERLMASELVALSSHEVIAAAVFLWCRAWKQQPAASLPDDDRVNAAFAKLPLPKFKKLREQVLRGFVKCSDGRLYHRVLALEAAAAFARKLAFQDRRKKDAERLSEWRSRRSKTRAENDGETHFVHEGQGGDREGKGSKDNPFPNGKGVHEPPDAELYRRGKEVLGASSGGMIRRLLASKGGNIPLARAALETASTKADRREYIGAIISSRNRDLVATDDLIS